MASALGKKGRKDNNGSAIFGLERHLFNSLAFQPLN